LTAEVAPDLRRSAMRHEGHHLPGGNDLRLGKRHQEPATFLLVHPDRSPDRDSSLVHEEVLADHHRHAKGG